MNAPVWINAADIHAFHLEMLSMFGGLDGVRDEGLLHSALSRPQHTFTYEGCRTGKLQNEIMRLFVHPNNHQRVHRG